MVRQVIGKGGLLSITILAIAMMTATYFFLPQTRIVGQLGLCLPSPNEWDIRFPSSWIVNTFGVLVAAAGMVFTNRKYNFIQSTDNVLPAALLVMLASNPLVTGYFCSSTILLAANIICMRIIFSTYKVRNATQEYFVVATILGLGAMIEYAFIPMIIPAIAGGVLMKSLRFKEILAFLMGLIAPYWVVLGLGLVAPEMFRLPRLSNLFDDFSSNSDLFIMMLSVGTTILISVVLSLGNSFRLYIGNSRVRAMNSAINVLGYVCVLCICLDFTNMPAYIGSLYLWAAVQMANQCNTDRSDAGKIWLWASSVLYVGFYIFMLL